MNTASISILITIIVYLAGVLIVGFHFARKNESASDFYLGGCKLGPLVTAMSAEASDMSSYLLMDLPALMAGLILAVILASSIFGIVSKRTTLPGAIADTIAGGVFAIYELLPAFIVGIVVIIAVSLLTKPPGQEIVAEFEAAKKAE